MSFTHHENSKLIDEFFNEIISKLLEEFNGEELPTIDIVMLSKEETFFKTFEIEEKISREKIYRKSSFHVDRMLCLMIAHSKSEQLSETMRNDFSTPLFTMMLQIIDGDEKRFINDFNSLIMRVEIFCIEKYSLDSDTSHCIASFLSIMLTAAIIHNRRLVINLLSEKCQLDAVDLILPKTMISRENLDYAAWKIIENQNNILSLKSYASKHMVTSEVMERFLDSRIRRVENEDRIKIDTAFLHGMKCDNLNSWYDKSEFLEYICNSLELRKHLAHPTITTYIDLKFNMYKKMFFWNFFSFLILTIAYFFDVVEIMSSSDVNVKRNFDATVTIIIVLMIFRELFQVWIVGGLKEHFRQSTNRWEFVLIVFLFLSMLIEVDPEEPFMFTCLTCVNILIMITLLTTMCPYSFMYRYMLLFKKVSKTFVKFLFTFMAVLFAFVLVFVVVFFDENEIYKNNNTILDETYQNVQNLSDKSRNEIEDIKEKEDFATNFALEHLGVAFTKVILMLSGEYDLKLQPLDELEIAMFFIFAIFTYICFNLIIGLTIDDVRSLKEDALRAVVLNRIQKISEINDNYSKFKR